jgi:DNA-binding CsgD family transcriptional regulator
MDTQTQNYITGDPAFAVDRRGVIVLWNEAAEESLGIPGFEALGQKCWKLLKGEDVYGNRYCCRHCPIRDMAFKHQPVHGFHSFFKTDSDKPEQFGISCVTILDEPGNEILLHICHPDVDSPVISPPQVSAGPAVEALSHRELQILGLLNDKVSTRDIATTLSISIRTVRTHIQHLLYKLHVHKRADAVNKGKRLKLI